jgi:hypothetical protein
VTHKNKIRNKRAEKIRAFKRNSFIKNPEKGGRPESLKKFSKLSQAL